MVSQKTKVYLATPYGWGNNKGLVAWVMHWWRFKKVTKVAAYWMERGFNVFSPITLTHPMSKYVTLKHAEWLEGDFQWINACDRLWVLCQPGWSRSDGVRQEIAHAKSIGLEIKYLKRGGTAFHTHSPNDWF